MGLRATCAPPCPSQDWESWTQLIHQRPGLFKSWVKRAFALQHLATCAMAKHIELHQFFASCGAPERAESEKPSLQDCTEACIACGRAFLNLPAWASHTARVHGYRAPGTKLTRAEPAKAVGAPMPRNRDLSDIWTILSLACSIGGFFSC